MKGVGFFMKKILIVLSLSIIFTFLILNNSRVSAQYNFADEFGYNMTYKTLILYDDFEFTGEWQENQIDDTYIFECTFEESLRFEKGLGD